MTRLRIEARRLQVLWTCLFLSLLLLLPPPPHASGDPASAIAAEELDSGEYVSLLVAARDKAPDDSPELEAIRQVKTVRGPDGAIYRVDNSGLIAGQIDLAVRLDTAIAEARHLSNVSSSPGDPRLEAGEIVSRPEFNREPSLASKILNKIRQGIDSVFGNRRIDPPTPNIPAPGPSRFATLVFYVLLAALAALATWLIVRAVARKQKAEESDDESDDEEIWGIGPADHRALGEAAEKAASEGRYSDAVRALFLSNLLLLDEKGVIRFDKTATNGQFRRVFAREFPDSVIGFDSATLTFERIHYGGEEADAADWTAARSSWASVWEKLGSYLDPPRVAGKDREVAR